MRTSPFGVRNVAAEYRAEAQEKWFAAWAWSLDTASLRVVLRGLRRADGRQRPAGPRAD